MARYSGAVWKPISGTSTTPLRADILCLHTMVGYMTSTWAYFNRTDVGVYSHFLVGGIWGGDAAAGLDGDVWQIADTAYRAAANLTGNPYIVSVETADNAPQSPADIAPWTAAQETAIVGILVWANRVHGIPLVLLPDSKPGQRGIAYHRLGCDPFRVVGGDLWSSAYGKQCPTNPRIARIPALIQRAKAIVNGTDPTPVPEPDTLEEIMALYPSAAAYEAGVAKATEAGVRAALVDWLPRTVGAMNGIDNAYFGANMNEQSALLAILAAVNNLATVLAPVPPNPAQATFNPEIHTTDPADPTGV